MTHRRKLDLDGVGIQVEDHGGDGAAVLLLHFGGSNLRMWDPVIPHLQGPYRCVALDLRAHGHSDAPPGGYHIDDMARDVAGVLDRLDLEQVHVVGSSIGAEVGLSLAANHPDRVRSLVAEGALKSEYGPYGTRHAASLAEDPEVQDQLRRSAAEPETVYTSRPSLVEATRKVYEEQGIWTPAMEAVLTYGSIETERGAIVSSWRKWARDAYMAIYYDLRFEDYYERVTCPVLMLPDEQTARDERCFEIAKRLSRLPRECEIVVVPGSVHPFGWMIIPEPMADAVLAFLARSGGRVGARGRSPGSGTSRRPAPPPTTRT